MIYLAITLNDMLLPAGIVLILAWLMLRLRKRGRTPTRITTPAEQIERQRQARGLRGDLEQVMVEVEQLAKRFGAQLDMKSVRLEKLIEQADARIAELKTLETPDKTAPATTRDDSAQGPVDTWSDTGSAPAPPAAADSPANGDLARTIYRLADAGNDPIEIGRILGEHAGKVELILALRET